MHHRLALLPLFAILALPGCGKDANTKICLDEFEKFETAVKAEDDQARQLAGGVYQSCGISCDVTEDADACAAFQRVTEVICDKEGKEACQELCDAGKGNDENPEKNEHACAKVASME